MNVEIPPKLAEKLQREAKKKNMKPELFAKKILREFLKEKVSTPIHSQCRKIFEVFYEQELGTPYYWKAQDAGNLNHLIQAINFKLKESLGEEHLVNAFSTYLIEAFKLTNDAHWRYVQTNFTISTLYGQFNAIFTEIKRRAGRREKAAEQFKAGLRGNNKSRENGRTASFV